MWRVYPLESFRHAQPALWQQHHSPTQFGTQTLFYLNLNSVPILDQSSLTRQH